MLCARVLRSFSLSRLSVRAKGAFSLYFSLTLSLLQHKSSSVFVSSAVLLLLFSNFNHERKRKLTWWIYKFSPSLLTFVCIFCWKYTTHTHHTHTHSYTHTPHTSIYCGTHCMLSLFVVTLLHATFAPHSFYLLIRLRLELSLSPAPHVSISLFLSLRPPPPVQRELMFYYVHKFSWVLIFLKFF